MPSFTKKILGALGVKSKAAPKAKQPAKPKDPNAPSERKVLIDQAMALYRQNAPAMRGEVEAALKQLKDQTPNFNDVDSLTRLLGIHRANLDMRRLMNHRDRRYLVLVGLRELLEQKPNPAPPGVKKLVVKR